MGALATLSFIFKRAVALRWPWAMWSAGLPVACGAHVAYAEAATACVDPRLHVDGTLAEHWTGMLGKLCEMVHGMRDADVSAQLQLLAAGEDIIVHVTLADGRSTLRRVRPGEDLLLTVEALVAMPPPLAIEQQPATTAPLAPAPPAAAQRADAGTSAEHASEAAPEPKPSSEANEMAQRAAPATTSAPASHVNHRIHALALELGGGTVARIAGSPLYGSIGIMGYAGLRVDSWMLGLAARWDGYQTVLRDRPKQLEMSTAGGGFLLLHRLLERHAIAIDGGVTTWLLSELQEHGEGDDERGGTIMDVRMGALARVVFGRRALRGSASLDAEISPGQLRERTRLDAELPLLPAWSVGLGLGVTWQGS